MRPRRAARERGLDRGRISLAARPLQARELPLERTRRHVQDRNRRLLALVDICVDPDDPPLAGIELALVAIGRVGDLALRIAFADGRDHPAPAVDLVDVAPHLPLGLVGQRFDEPRPAERIDRRVHAGFLGDDLLLAEGEQRGLRRRHGQCLVVGVRMERLRPAQHTGESLERDAGQVVERLLRGQRHAGRLGVEAHPRRCAHSRRRSAWSSDRARCGGSPGTWRSPRRSRSAS